MSLADLRVPAYNRDGPASSVGRSQANASQP